MVDKVAISKNIGKILKTLRTQRKLSMQNLATLAEIEKSQIVRIEAGKVDAKLSTIIILCNALQVDISDFFKLYEDL
ncbi:MAG: XRE family transcriptional regulator [Sphingobacteriales bacterium]|jgi:transcriptional regulator with XRE-family HTH domain|nr:MAG: XRE family transcriptional regulator [Sphingobacteriales bacterium]